MSQNYLHLRIVYVYEMYYIMLILLSVLIYYFGINKMQFMFKSTSEMLALCL